MPHYQWLSYSDHRAFWNECAKSACTSNSLFSDRLNLENWAQYIDTKDKAGLRANSVVLANKSLNYFHICVLDILTTRSRSVTQMYSARQFTLGAAESKQSSGVYCVYTPSIGNISHIETVNNNSIWVNYSVNHASWSKLLYQFLHSRSIWLCILRCSSNTIPRKWCNVV